MGSQRLVRASGRWKVVWGTRACSVFALALAVTSTGCGQLQRQGQASSYLIVEELSAGGSTFLLSDVITNNSILNDVGEARFRLAMKDPGVGSPNTPTSANYLTVDRYHVQFVRADGRNTPGVDVPYAFDGALSITVIDTASVAFTIVRNIAKAEAPLAALASNRMVISTIARVTFYGHDQTGREVSATASISVDFGNFADSAS